MSTSSPESVQVEHREWRWSVAWQQDEGATVWRLSHPAAAVRYLKVGAADRWPNAGDEAARLRWARPFLPVPQVVTTGGDGATDWLLTEALPGTDATKHPLRDDPAQLVDVLAHALAHFHAAAPVATCPYDFRVPAALAHVRARVERGLVDAAVHLHPEHAHLDVDAAIEMLQRLAPDKEDVVVCHGDYCLPNVLLDGSGRVTGYLDLGELGVADRWWDVAVGAWSVTWNLGPEWEDRFYRAYGVDPDPDRIAFYRLLYDLAS
jgi:kanamycin kinase